MNLEEYKQIWEKFNNLTVDAEFTRQLLFEGISQKIQTKQSAISALLGTDAIVLTRKDNRTHIYKKVYDVSWSVFEREIREYFKILYETQWKRKKAKKNAKKLSTHKPVEVEIEQPKEKCYSEFVVVKADDFEKMKSMILYYPKVLEDKNIEIQKFKDCVATQIDIIAKLKKELEFLVKENKDLREEVNELLEEQKQLAIEKKTAPVSYPLADTSFVKQVFTHTPNK